MVQVFAPREKPIKTMALKCSLRQRTVCTYESFVKGRGITADTTKFLAVSLNDCNNALAFRRYAGEIVFELKPKLFGTNVTLPVDFKYCCYEHCTTVLNLYIEQGEVATLDGKTFFSDLGDVGGCASNPKQCHQEDGTISWNPHAFTKMCAYQPLGMFRANLVVFFFVLPGLQASFNLQEPHKECDSKPGHYYMTNQGMVIWSEITLKTLATHPNNLTATPDPESARFSFLADYLGTQEDKTAAQLQQRLCHQDQMILDHLWQMLQFEPTMGARALLQRKDIVAEFHGDALVISQCHQMTPTFTYTDYQIGKNSYKFLPVKINEKLYFVVPRTTDLTDNSHKVDCVHQNPGIFWNDTGWYTLSGETHVQTVPINMQYLGLWKSIDFNTPALYHDGLAGFTVAFQNFRHYVSKTDELATVLRKTINYTVTSSMDPDSLYQALAGTGAAIGQGLESAGRTLEHLIASDTKMVGSLFDSLTKGPFRVILDILICIIILAAIVYITYFCWPYCAMLRPSGPRRPRGTETYREDYDEVQPTMGQVLMRLARTLRDQ